MSEVDHSAVIDALRSAGADQLDPVHLHYLEALARRANTQSSSVKRILDAKLTHALAVFNERLEHANGDGKAGISPSDGCTPLSDLARYIAQQTPKPLDAGTVGRVGAPFELKAIRQFRNTWSKLSVDKQVAQALDQAPKNAGPINSHMLVLRSLALMRDTSPDYLNRFMSYVDTLLCLDQGDAKSKPVPKKPATGKATKK
jgi:hypothetical protein